jgi:anaerobic selenocysteine-containing dehydrogenase
MLSCEDAYHLAHLALELDPGATLGIGPIPVKGQDKTFPGGQGGGYTIYAEKCPNSRGVKRVLDAVAAASGGKATVCSFAEFVSKLNGGSIKASIITGNFPSDWATPDLLRATQGSDMFTVAIDTIASELTRQADVVLPGCTWVEKAGTFENAKGLLQAFEQAIPPNGGAGISKSEAQIALDLSALCRGVHAQIRTQEVVINPTKAGQVPDGAEIATPIADWYNAAATRQEMADKIPALHLFVSAVSTPAPALAQEPDMEVVEL